MKANQFRKLTINSTILGFCAIVMAQGQSGTPGGGGTDSNPYNMANWEVLPTTGTHTTEKTRHYRNELGQVVSETETLNNLGGGITAYVIAHNTSGEFLSAKSKTVANVKIRWRWRGLGTCPAKVWVLKQATSWGSVSPDGTIAVSNGLGGVVVPSSESTTSMKTATSKKLIETSTNGGMLEESFECEATATSTHSIPTFFNIADSSVGYSLALKGVTLGVSTGITFKKGADGARVIASRGEAYSTGNDIMGPVLGGNAVVGWGGTYIYLRSLVGEWINPFHHWEDDSRSWIDDLFNEYESVQRSYLFSYSQVRGIPTSGPEKKEMSLKVKDVHSSMDQTSIEEKLTLYIHTPIMYPHFTRESAIYYKGVNDLEVNHPGFAVGGGGIGCSWNQVSLIWDIFGFLSSTADIAGLFNKHPWIAGITAAAGFLEENFAPKPYTGNAPWAWGWIGSTYGGSSVPPSVPLIPGPDENNDGQPDYMSPDYSGWRMVPDLKEGWTDKTFRGDKYDSNGFHSETESVASVKIRNHYRWVGHFSYQGPWGGTGGDSMGGNR